MRGSTGGDNGWEMVVVRKRRALLTERWEATRIFVEFWKR
jgi:hypothetical protein